MNRWLGGFVLSRTGPDDSQLWCFLDLGGLVVSKAGVKQA